MSSTTKKRALAAESLQQGEKKDRKEDAFEIMMNAATKRAQRNNKRPLLANATATEPDPSSKKQPHEPTNALDKLMSTARRNPFAFYPNTSDQDILGYLNRHPEWRLMISELVRQEKEQEQAEEEEEEEDVDFKKEENEEIRTKIYSMEKSLQRYEPSLADAKEQQIWQVEDLRRQQHSLHSNRTNNDLSLPPTHPNEDSVLVAVHVHFEEVEEDHPGYGMIEWTTVICGWTLIYNDHVEVSFGVTESSRSSINIDTGANRISNIVTTVKVQLQTNEHIQSIGTHVANFLSPYRIGFLTTKNRWLIASEGKLIQDNKWETSQGQSIWIAPGGEILQYINLDTSDGDLTISIFKTTPLGNLNSRRSGISTLSTMCEEKLQEYLEKASSDASTEAYTKLQDLFHWELDNHCVISFDYQLELQTSQEAEILRSLILLKNVATNRFEMKYQALLHKAKLEQQKSIQASQSKAEEACKIPCRQEQNRIYADHMAFLETKARLSGEDNNDDDHDDDPMDTNTRSTKKALCIFPQCRKIYLPKNLPLWKRCMFGDCGTAFEMCGCMISICPKCFKSFCPWHIDLHQEIEDKVYRSISTSSSFFKI